jgi:hypothetical protein
VTVPDAPVTDSVAVIVQKPTPVPGVYVTVAWPRPLVTADIGAKDPQFEDPPLVDGATEKLTVSSDTAAPVLLVTVAVIVNVLVVVLLLLLTGTELADEVTLTE